MSKTKKIKLRAECLHDVHSLMAKLSHSEYRVISKMLPDVEVVITSSQSIESIKEILKTIPDSHVMIETIALQKNYTGERIR